MEHLLDVDVRRMVLNWLLELLAYFHLTCSVNVFQLDVIDFVVPIKFLSKLQL